MRIDAHIHYTPPSFIEALSALAEQEPYWGLLLDPAGSGGTRPAAGPDCADAGRMIADMDAAGLDRAVIMGSYWQRHETCVERNSEVLDLLRRWPDRLLAFATIQPKAGAKALDELERCLNGGMCGVGELGPYGQGYTLEDPDFLCLVERCIERGIPLNLHTNEEVGHYYPGKSATPIAAYYRLACRYPELKLILAHWGGGLCFYEMMPEVRRQLTNVSYDTAASPLLFPTPEIFRAALGCLDHHKILYASDYPLRLYRKRQAEPSFVPFLEAIAGLGLDPAVEADILGNNAARLLGLGDMESKCSGARVEAQDKRPVPAVRGLFSRSRAPALAIDDLRSLSVRAAVEAWPATRAVFDRYGIPWQEGAAPFWEPVAQVAAAHGYGPAGRARLLADLNTAIGPA